jgi:predicted AlkP superfamily pyrophosphatase or phosphodiesterase
MDVDRKRLLVVQVAGLGYEFLTANHGTEWDGLTFHPADGVFPALTCTAQASFRTASAPQEHGMVANGLWDRRYAKARFWEQSALLVEGERFWKDFRDAGHTVGMLFWQQSLGEGVDVVLSPAPIHKHHGGMIQDCYSHPAGLYDALRAKVGRDFNLMHYWGPLASHRSSAWIADATAALMSDPELAPDLCLTYLPVLDYDLQRYGTAHPRSRRALTHLLEQLRKLRVSAALHGYEVFIFGDYALGNVTAPPALPNLELRKRGFLEVRNVRGMTYPDLHASRAFAVADHEIAQVFVRDSADLDDVRKCLEGVAGVADVLDRGQQREQGVGHGNAGEFLLVAEEGSWMAYPWWEDAKEAPDYAGHVDIHSKPGYDPCELFWGWPPGSTSAKLERVRGTHGRTGEGRKIAWASTCIKAGAPTSLVELAAAVGKWCVGSGDPASSGTTPGQGGR